MSMRRAKCIRQSPRHRLRFIFLDPFAVLSRSRTGRTFGCTHRFFPGLRVTEALLTFLFLAGCSFSVPAQIESSRGVREEVSTLTTQENQSGNFFLPVSSWARCEDGSNHS